jgi:drug/metabolite transporter (DMT)-like permease
VLAWTLGSLLSQHGFALARGAIGFASQMLCGGLALLVLATLRGEWGLLQHNWPPTPTALLAWLYLVVFGSLIAFNAYMTLLSRASAALASSYCFVNPVIAMLLGVGLGGERVSPYEWRAAGVVLFGVVLVLLARARAGSVR